MVTKQEKQWQAESDAYTLLEAEAIKQDKSRMSNAKTKVKEIAKEKVKAGKAAEKAVKSLSKKKQTTRKKKK